MRITLVAAVSRNGIIGTEGRLPWHLPGDLKRFKALTMGHVLVMGRRTWESIGRPLPGRRSIVITRSSISGIETAKSLDEALAAASGAEEVFLIGGAGVYREGVLRADRLHLTRVQADVEGDVRFPDVDMTGWRLQSTEDYPAGPGDAFSCRVEVFDRNSRS